MPIVFLSLMVYFFSSPSLSLLLLLSSVYIFSFIYLFLCLHHQNYHYCYNQYTFFFVYLFLKFFPIECQATCFKNSSYIFSKSGRDCVHNRWVCEYQGGDLVSIETEKEWQFINDEIQKRGTSNTSAWHIGLYKEYNGTWTWFTGEKLSISKWRDSQPDGNDNYAEISKNGGLFNGISWGDKNAFICEIPGGKITFQP